MKLVAATTLAVGAGAVAGTEGTMRAAFDALTHFAVRLPGVQYPEDKWQTITDCMATAGDTLYPTASDAAWVGWTQFGINGGQPGDEWNINNTAPWMEYDPRNLHFQGHQFPIIEPCNTLSNLAYYRIIPDMCSNRKALTMSDEYVNAIIQGFATLGMGSSFMHGSRTNLGGTFDNVPIGVIAYQYFQLMTDSLKLGAAGSDSVLHELSATARAYDGRELATKIHTIPLTVELNDWNTELNKLDLPDYFFTFGAIIVNALTLIAPDAICDALIGPLTSLFGLDPAVRTFLIESYVPTLRGAKDFQLTLKEKEALMPQFAGTIMKLLWAFTWQEQTFLYSFVYNPTWNLFGDLLIPSVFSLANKLTGFAHDDQDFQKGKDLYPGQDYCNVKATAPHAKWHSISATGLLDLGYLADAVRTVIDTAQEPGSAELRLGSTEDEVFMTTDIIDTWAEELKAESWSEGYLVRQGFAAVVKEIATDMDSCGSGSADGSITWKELTCYVTNISSAESFVQMIFDGISAHYNPSLKSVHHTPPVASESVFV